MFALDEIDYSYEGSSRFAQVPQWNKKITLAETATCLPSAEQYFLHPLLVQRFPGFADPSSPVAQHLKSFLRTGIFTAVLGNLVTVR